MNGRNASNIQQDKHAETHKVSQKYLHTVSASSKNATCPNFQAQVAIQRHSDRATGMQFIVLQAFHSFDVNGCHAMLYLIFSIHHTTPH